MSNMIKNFLGIRDRISPRINSGAKGLLLLCLVLCFSGNKCDSGVLFKTIGNELAAPISVAVDTAKLRAYVVNSNNTFEFTSTTFSVLDITDPASPVLLDNPANPFPVPDFSGQIYLDTASGFAYTPNRASDNSVDTVDALLRINVDESSSSFGTVETFSDGENPFGISCCDGAGRIYVVASGGKGVGTLDVFDPADLSTFVQVSLEVQIASGKVISGRDSTEVVLSGNQAFVSNRLGNIYVINTDEVGDTTKNPVDAIVLNSKDLRGIATDGTSLYVVDGDRKTLVLRVIPLSSLAPVDPDVSTVSEFDIGDVETAAISLGSDKKTDPQEVRVFNGKAYVTNRGLDTVAVIDVASQALETTIAVGDEPFGMTAFTVGDNNYLYVTNLVSDSISIIDLATHTVVNTFAP